MAYNPFRSADNLPNRESLAAAQVVDSPVLGVQRLERQNVGVCQVSNVDVVSDAGSISSCIVCTEHFDKWPPATCCLQYQWNQVRLRVMHFPDAPSPTRIEA